MEWLYHAAVFFRRKYQRSHSAQNHEREAMKKFKLFFVLAAFLLFVPTADAQTPVVGSHPASSTGPVNVATHVGDLLLIFCVPDPPSSIVASDSAGDSFTALPAATSFDSSAVVGFWARASVDSSSLSLKCTPSASATYNQIYTAVISGAGTPLAVPNSGTSGKASATIPSASGHLVLAMVESGTVSNSSGWTALSTLDSNLLASQTAAGSVAPSFTVSSAWNLLLVDVPPAPSPSANIVLTASGSVKFDDGTTVYTGAVGVSQLNGTAWVQAGSVNSDVNGVLTGSLIVNPNLAVNGVINLQFSIPVVGSTSLALPLLQLQQGATTVTLTSVLYKSVLLPKSFALAVTP
jgi:hypothetical protein